MDSQEEATLSDLAAARQELLDALAGLSGAGLESPLGPDQWRIRDVLAHTNHWNRWGLNRLRHIVKHGEGVAPGSAIDADALNRLVAEAWALHTVKDVLIELENCYEDVVAFLRSPPPEWTDGTWQYRGRRMTLRPWFGYAAGHERSHAEQLHGWRGSRDRESGRDRYRHEAT